MTHSIKFSLRGNNILLEVLNPEHTHTMGRATYLNSLQPDEVKVVITEEARHALTQRCKHLPPDAGALLTFFESVKTFRWIRSDTQPLLIPFECVSVPSGCIEMIEEFEIVRD